MLMSKLREAHSATSVHQSRAASDKAQHAQAAEMVVDHMDRSEAEDQSVADEALDMRRESSKGIGSYLSCEQLSAGGQSQTCQVGNVCLILMPLLH